MRSGHDLYVELDHARCRDHVVATANAHAHAWDLCALCSIPSTSALNQQSAIPWPKSLDK